jgi:large subunit ribosomal protein L37Ae
MSKTKKAGSTGRFGARYGLKIRKKVLEIEKIQRHKHKCPFCAKLTVKRLSAGIWYCKSCKTKFAGGAYEPGISKLAKDLAKGVENV